MMNKEQVYKELNDQWNLFNMTEEEIEKAYCEITGLEKTEEQTILDLKEYLLEYVLEQMIRDKNLAIPLAGKIIAELLEKWKQH